MASDRPRRERKPAPLPPGFVATPASDAAVLAAAEAAAAAEEGERAAARAAQAERRAARKQKAEEKAAEEKAAEAEGRPVKKRTNNRRLCASYARERYGLSDKDLHTLTNVEYRENPHYRSAAPMRLYLVSELKALAEAKKARKAREAEQREQLAAEREAAAKEARHAAAEAAREKVHAFAGSKRRKERHGSTDVPDECLSLVMGWLVGSLEPGGVVGPSALARDLANASLVCWDFTHASRAAIHELSAAVSRMPHARPPHYCWGERAPAQQALLAALYDLPGALEGGWDTWQRLLAEPTKLKLPQLKQAARQLGLTVGGTKPELVLRLLGAFGLTAPSRTARPQLLRALLLERSTLYCAWDGPDHGQATSAAIHSLAALQHAVGTSAASTLSLRGVAAARRALLDGGIASQEQLLALVQRLQSARRQQAVALQPAAPAPPPTPVSHALQMWQPPWASLAAAAAAPALLWASPAAAAPALPWQPQQALAPRAPPPRRGSSCASCGRNTPSPTCERGCCGPCCSRLGGAPGAGWCARHGTGTRT